MTEDPPRPRSEDEPSGASNQAKDEPFPASREESGDEAPDVTEDE